jgi:uncharacterized protein YegP (UPF0339 family)
MAKFEIFKQKDGDYHFHLRADNNEIIATSEGYTSLDGARNGIEAVKNNAHDLGRYDLVENQDRQWYFNLRARNGEIIATSEMYTTFENVKSGALLVDKYASKAAVEELIPA